MSSESPFSPSGSVGVVPSAGTSVESPTDDVSSVGSVRPSLVPIGKPVSGSISGVKSSVEGISDTSSGVTRSPVPVPSFMTSPVPGYKLFSSWAKVVSATSISAKIDANLNIFFISIIII